MSHPLVEGLIASTRGDLLDQTFFWTATDLEIRLREFSAITTSVGLIPGEMVVPWYQPSIARFLI
jgi:hypothetical protein